MNYEYDISQLARRQAELGFCDLELSKRAGVHPSTVKNVFTGRTAKPGTLRKIAEALGIDLADIVIPSTTQEAVA